MSFSINLEIYTLHCDPAEEKNIIFLKVSFSFVFFPQEGKVPPPPPLPLPSSLLSLFHLDEWMQRQGNTWTHWHNDEHRQRAAVRWEPNTKPPNNTSNLLLFSHTHTQTHSASYSAYIHYHKHTHSPSHRLQRPSNHSKTIVKNKKMTPETNWSPNNDIKNKTIRPNTIIISAWGQRKAGCSGCVILSFLQRVKGYVHM